MRRITTKSFMAKALLVGVVTVLSLAGTALPASAASTAATTAAVSPALDFTDCGAAGDTVYWYQVVDGWEGFIFRPHTTVICLASSDLQQLLGFSALTTSSTGVHHLEICDYVGSAFYARINVADSNGNATSQVITYSDPAGGGCFLRDLGYPIRKFRAAWDVDIIVSDWQPPAP